MLSAVSISLIPGGLPATIAGRLLLKGMLFWGACNLLLIFNTDLSPMGSQKTMPPSLAHLFPVATVLLHFRVLQSPWVGSFLQLENTLVTQRVHVPLWASKASAACSPGVPQEHSSTASKQQRLEDTCTVGDTIPG